MICCIIRKICGILQEIIIHNKNYLIVDIGLNTNVAPKQKLSSTSLKNIISKYR